MDALALLKKHMPPFAHLLGIELISASPEKIVAELRVRDDLRTRPAVLHGGAIKAFGDTLGAISAMLNLPERSRHDRRRRQRCFGRSAARSSIGLP